MNRLALVKIAARSQPGRVDDKPKWFPKAILAGAMLGAAHGALRPHSAFSGGVELGRQTLRSRLSGMAVGSTVGASLGWMPQIIYEGTHSS